ncbi:unnamed protein product [Pedinophyceae sp. YPF-701]|nr:unnamed protein product [Pedinophyceae sp. YPF-701]
MTHGHGLARPARCPRAPPSVDVRARAAGPHAARGAKIGTRRAGQGISQPHPGAMRCRAEPPRPLASAASLPLDGRRIAVTSPRQYAGGLSQRLVDAGARPIWTPTIEIRGLTERGAVEELDGGARALLSGAYTHVLFSSKNGVYALMAHLEDLCGTPEAAARALSASASVWALGADGEVARALGVEPCEVPPEASTQGLVRELVARGEADGARALVPVPTVAGGLREPPVVPRFMAALEAAGVHAHRVPAYETVLADAGDCAVELRMLEEGDVAAVVFTSTAEAQGLAAHFGGAAAAARALERGGVVIAAHGPYTARGVRETLGLDVPVVGVDYSSFQGVTDALCAHFAPPS